MTIRLIALDLDGTTLRRDGTVSDRTVAALRRAMDAGVTVSVATGRLHNSALLIARRIGANGPIISSNGGLVRTMDGSTLLHMPLPASFPDRALAFARQTGVSVELFAGDVLYASNPAVKRWERRQRLLKARSVRGFVDLWQAWRSFRVADLAEWRPTLGLPEKLFAGDPDPARLRQVVEALGAGLCVTASAADNVELTAPGVTKGSAVAWLAARLGIGLQQVMVAGDSLNDLSMFELDCLKVAMGNAEDAIKERASFVTASHMDDGVALAVERFVLKGAVA